MFGYESWVYLQNSIIPATAAETGVDRAKIESEGLLGGTIAGSNMPLGQAHIYDWPIISASFTTEASAETLSVIKNMIFNRNTPISIVVHNGYQGTQKIDQAWWNNITIQASEDSIITASVSLTGLERTAFDTGDFPDYWRNADGTYGSFCFSPIPFWNSKVVGYDYAKSWSLSISQDVIRFMGCMNYAGDTPRNPFIMGVGTLNGNFKFSTFDEYTGIDIWAMPEKFSGTPVINRTNLGLIINGSNFVSMTGEIVTVSDPMQNGANRSTIDYDYQIYSIS